MPKQTQVPANFTGLVYTDPIDISSFSTIGVQNTFKGDLVGSINLQVTNDDQGDSAATWFDLTSTVRSINGDSGYFWNLKAISATWIRTKCTCAGVGGGVLMTRVSMKRADL